MKVKHNLMFQIKNEDEWCPFMSKGHLLFTKVNLSNGV